MYFAILLKKTFFTEHLLMTASILQQKQEIRRKTRFFSFDGPVIISIFIRTTDRYFRDQGNVRHPTLMFLKCDLIQISNTFQIPFLRIFDAGKASLVFVKLQTLVLFFLCFPAFCKFQYHFYKTIYYGNILLHFGSEGGG